MAYEQLRVVGIGIRPNASREPVYLPTRKFFHAKCFHDERYRHEIANHYRDFKRHHVYVVEDVVIYHMPTASRVCQ